MQSARQGIGRRYQMRPVADDGAVACVDHHDHESIFDNGADLRIWLTAKETLRSLTLPPWVWATFAIFFAFGAAVDG